MIDIYEKIKQELSIGSNRPSDNEILHMFPDYSLVVMDKALRYSHGIINKPDTTELVFHSNELIFAPIQDQEWDELEQVTGGFYHSYWIDDAILQDLSLDIDEGLTLLQAYLNAEKKIIVPIFVCGGL